MPYPLIDSNPGWAGFFEFGKPWNTIDENDPAQNPWANSNDPLLVPFDTQVRHNDPLLVPFDTQVRHNDPVLVTFNTLVRHSGPLSWHHS